MIPNELSLIIEELNTLISYKAFSIVNMMLDKAIHKFSNMSPEKIVTYARTTYIVRKDLPIWDTFVTKAKVHFNANNLDTNKLLQGLI